MFVAKFKLQDPEDIYSPLNEHYKVDFFASPYTHYEKDGLIHVIVGGIIVGSENNKKKYVVALRKDERVQSVDVSKDFILVHATHKISREARAEIKIFYNPQYLRIKPILVSSDGWEYWEIACVDREELNKLVLAAKKYYSGKLFSIKKQKITSISSLAISPNLSEQQIIAIQTALKEGYYNYPRNKTIPELAKKQKKSYTTFQEHLRKAENKIIAYFFNYR